MKREINSIYGIGVITLVGTLFTWVILAKTNETHRVTHSYSHITNSSFLDGEYVWDSQTPYSSSEIDISKSTPDGLFFSISTTNFAHLGNLNGYAKRDTSTSSLTFKTRINNGAFNQAYDGDEKMYEQYYHYCDVTITFPDNKSLYITTSLAGCRLYHGARGMFFDDELHVKNGKVTLPTIIDLGFTQDDRSAFNKLLPNALQSVEGFIDKDTANELKSYSADTLALYKAYSIETGNIYTTLPCEDFSQDFGYCSYVAIMKDFGTGYWIIYGSNGNEFTYATTAAEWKNKLPSIFQDELDRLNVRPDQVLYSK